MGTNPKQTSIHHMNISSTPRREAKKRIEELDFLKALFILLMIAFHLVYIPISRILSTLSTCPDS